MASLFWSLSDLNPDFFMVNVKGSFQDALRGDTGDPE
jgi:hypothetical protein